MLFGIFLLGFAFGTVAICVVREAIEAKYGKGAF